MTDEGREDLNTFKHDLVKQARWWQWKAETLEKENEQIKAENTALRERLEKAVEFPRIRKSANYARTGKYVVEFIREDDGGVDLDIDLTKEEAEARLKELKEKKQ